MRHSALRRAATFCAVVRRGTIRAAGAELGLSPSAVHHELKLYARELGQPLFARVGRKLTPTPQARRLYADLQAGFRDLEAATARFRSAAAALPLRIGSVTGFGRYRLSPLLFNGLEPDRPVRLVFGSHDETVAALLEGQVDAAITYKPTVAVPLVSFPLAEERLVLICSRALAPAAERDLGGLPFVTYDEYEYVFARWFAEHSGGQPARLNLVDHTNELEEALQSVMAGRGATIAPADAWRAVDAHGTCVVVGARGRQVVNQVYALSLAGGDPTALAALKALFDREPQRL